MDACVGHAQEQVAEAPEELRRPSRRALPDYDGRPASPPTPGDQLLWVPRVLLWPVYSVTEYLVRLPLGRLLSTAEEAEVPQRLMDAFLFGPDDQILFAPTASLDFGLRPNVGLMFRYQDAFARGHSVSASLAYGGANLVSLSAGTGYEPTHGDWELDLSGRLTRRPDGLFYGIGREAQRAARTRYQSAEFDVSATLTVALPRQSALRVASGYKALRFGDARRGTRIADLVNQGIVSALPEAFATGYESLWGEVELILDSRPDRPAPGSGVRFHSDLLAAVDPGEGTAWLRYGASLGGFLDLSGAQHVLSATLSVHFAEALTGRVPFTELPVLSGTGPMRGFVDRLLIGESDVAFSLEYCWPIWVYADAKLHVAFGNVFGPRLDGFEVRDLRMSFGVGLAAVTSRTAIFEILVGAGTDTFERGGDVESVRVLLGVTRDF